MGTVKLECVFLVKTLSSFSAALNEMQSKSPNKYKGLLSEAREKNQFYI